MADVTPEQVREQLRRVKGPDMEGDIVDLGLVSDIVVNDGKVIFSISIDPARAEELEPLRQAAQEITEGIDGVTQVLVGLTAHSDATGNAGNGAARDKPAPGAGPGTIQPPMAGKPGQQPSGQQPSGQHPPGQQPPGQQPPGQGQKAGVPGIGAIIAVASGKGGVGKSTTAANLALAFQSNGLKVGILDADIYGPSMPRLMNISGRPQPSGNGLKPMDGYGVKVMSMGLLVEEDTPMIWRGPMVISALTQMLREVVWGELDVLVVDMPPGTGDAQLTMAQQVPLAGAVIVSTPQDLALLDARKGVNMFRKVDVPILGIVENMSYFLCPNCGERSEIFGHGGARAEADKFGVEFLGEVPLNIAIRKTSDEGHPVVISDPESAFARIYRDIASKTWAEVERNRQSDAHAAPNIVIE